MDDEELDINAIAQQLNTRARTHAIGKLQTIRAELKGLARRPGTDIFSLQTIHEDWAFHHGGRSELQFNIGREDAFGGIELRHGVAFSFEPSPPIRSEQSLNIVPKLVRIAVIGLVLLIGYKGVQALIVPPPIDQQKIEKTVEGQGKENERRHQEEMVRGRDAHC